MMNKKTIFRWWWIWQYEKMEQWLEAQEKQGWQLVGAGWNLLKFQFEQGAPRTIRYVFDYQNKADEEYVELYEDAGWEAMNDGRKNGWYLWRKAYPADQPQLRPEIYSDVESMIQRNDRMKKTILTMGLLMVAILVLNMVVQYMWQVRITMLVVYLGIFILFLHGIRRINEQNRKLQDRSSSIKSK